MTEALDNPVWYALTGSRKKPCVAGTILLKRHPLTLRRQ